MIVNPWTFGFISVLAGMAFGGWIATQFVLSRHYRRIARLEVAVFGDVSDWTRRKIN